MSKGTKQLRMDDYKLIEVIDSKELKYTKRF